MDKFAAIDAFAQVVENEGFAAAARQMRVSRSQVNKAVINLEDHLGVQLLNRTTRHVAPTPSGIAFYQKCRTILDDLAEAERGVRDSSDAPVGTLKINAPLSFGVSHFSPALIDFMKRYPDITTELDLSDRFVDPITDGYDMTIRIGAPQPMPSLIDHEIVEMKRVLCAAPEFLKKHNPPQAPEDLAALPCLHYGNLTTGNTWPLVREGVTKNVQINGTLCSNNGDVLRDGAVAGLGIALLPTFIAGKEIQAGRLVTVLPEWKPTTLQLCLLYPPNRHLAARVRLLVEFMYERFGGQPYWDLVD
jgi:DNA-binding transcriptional LysR family regulator